MFASHERKHRIELMHRKWVENEEKENFEYSYQTLGSAWASVTPLMKNHRFTGEYRIVMHKLDNRNARHASLNTLRWNRKTLNVTHQQDFEDQIEVCAKEGDTWQTTAC